MVLIKVVSGGSSGPQQARVVNSALLRNLWDNFKKTTNYDTIPEGSVATNIINDPALPIYKIYTDDRRGMISNNPSNMDKRNVALIKFVNQVLQKNY